MSRTKKQKMVQAPPLFTSFKPAGVMRGELESVSLSLDEFEAIRLADYLQMDHLDAAVEMEISRSTFSRLVERARKKMALLLIEGKELSVEGGNVHFKKNRIKCLDCGYIFSLDMNTSFEDCPECKSTNIKNLARGFGHGRCCANDNRKMRQNC